MNEMTAPPSSRVLFSTETTPPITELEDLHNNSVPSTGSYELPTSHPLSRNQVNHHSEVLLNGNSDDEEEIDMKEDKAFIHTSPPQNQPKNSSQKELISLNIMFPKYYFSIAKHILIFMSVMIICAMCSGFVFRESTKLSVPYFRVGEYAYQQGTLIHGHFFSIGVFIPLTLLVMLFISFMISGRGVSKGIFHGGFIIFEIGAILALLAFCYKALSFLSLVKESPNINIHELELRTWGSTSSFGGKNDGSGSMGAKMLRMIYFGFSHGFMLIGLAKCVLVIVYSLMRKKNN
ncbi:hypothetical protein C9374_005701 [Naegleria lovaniensis]|uniref:Uncharacterized protein n=1 Tax=Naegleria lovaniensis TaxID=51637 RepID=A0AA88GMW0_NAELO|nr:uncharacterized protein C9374_005701 [Naegleria lovaniensis]KAG2381909.1 hypothetical protein C9374_005701 [Naegleria lovaniensis]